jgi:hypothetical protein
MAALMGTEMHASVAWRLDGWRLFVLLSLTRALALFSWIKAILNIK